MCFMYQKYTNLVQDSRPRNTYCVVIFIHELFVVLFIFHTGGSNTYHELGRT